MLWVLKVDVLKNIFVYIDSIITGFSSRFCPIDLILHRIKGVEAYSERCQILKIFCENS